jgi:hypothetical protein
VGVTADSNRAVLGVDVGDSEDELFWTGFLPSLKARGLTGVSLVVSDAHAGLKAAARVLQGAACSAAGSITPTSGLCRPGAWIRRLRLRRVVLVLSGSA